MNHLSLSGYLHTGQGAEEREEEEEEEEEAAVSPGREVGGQRGEKFPSWSLFFSN